MIKIYCKFCKQIVYAFEDNIPTGKVYTCEQCFNTIGYTI